MACREEVERWSVPSIYLEVLQPGCSLVSPFLQRKHNLYIVNDLKENNAMPTTHWIQQRRYAFRAYEATVSPRQEACRSKGTLQPDLVQIA